MNQNGIFTFSQKEQEALALIYVFKHSDNTTSMEQMCQMYYSALEKFHAEHIKITNSRK